MRILTAYKSDIGRNEKRQNEDYIWVDEKLGLYIVADGMGGQEAGEIASQLASTTIADMIRDQLNNINEPPTEKVVQTLVTEAMEAANETVFKAAKAAEQRRKMGATIVVALLQSPTVYISHAGDARAYLIRGATIMQLTRDDSWVAELEAEGLVEKDEMRDHIYGHIVTKAIGQDKQLSPSFTLVTLRPGDWLILCSDGLWNMIEDEQILAEIQNAKGDPDQAVEGLIAAANEEGGKDNISIVAIQALETPAETK